MSIKPRPLIAGAKRFRSHIDSDIPGVGTYCPCDCFRNKKDFYKGCAPFNCDASRFLSKDQHPTPGPGDYQVKSPLQEKLEKKRNKYSIVNVPFNHTAERKMSFVHDDQYCMPGPANYCRNLIDENQSLPVHGVAFKSRVPRFNPKISESAEPASYSISKAFNKNRSRTSHNNGKAPFLAQEPRPPVFGKLSDTPGPTLYLSQGDLRDRGLYFNTDFPRFPCTKEDVPGPGTYNVSQSVGGSLGRAVRTHNVKLQEEVESRLKKKRKPKDGENGKKQKVLRWFVQPSVDYRHCVFVM